MRFSERWTNSLWPKAPCTKQCERSLGDCPRRVSITRWLAEWLSCCTATGVRRLTLNENLVGRGYAPLFPGAKKGFRDIETGVEIDILTQGEYPGDGKPKPVSFPNPATASTEIDGIRIVTLDKLVELKLASGMTAPHRLRDLADVQELIKLHGLGAEFTEQLDPYVRSKYLELWDAVARADDSEGESSR
jgi:hypothetical protein